MRTLTATLLLVVALSTFSVPVAAGTGEALQTVDDAARDPFTYVRDTLNGGNPLDPGPGSGEEDAAAPPESPGFDDAVRQAFQDEALVVSAASLAAALLGVAGFGLVTRYISPKEALKNPQRAMLYGFIRATPGAHLKQLSEEFKMKSSSILWHIRKLESADLVRSDRANGYRVFYPVEGGVELRRVSRAIAALQNENARRTFTHLQRHTGCSAAELARALTIHPGTVRWHLRKMREFGLVEELVSDQASRYFVTPLGQRAIETLEGSPAGNATATKAPVPIEGA